MKKIKKEFAPVLVVQKANSQKVTHTILSKRKLKNNINFIIIMTLLSIIGTILFQLMMYNFSKFLVYLYYL